MAACAPFVSGIMAAYNYERYIAESLESALCQDYPPDRLELIVVDDGSTDGTSAIARRYADDSGGRVRYFRQNNAGPAAATTRGLQEVRGDMIALLDADDLWPVSRTRLLVDALLRNPDAGLVYGDLEVIDDEGRTIAPSWLQEASQTPFRGNVVAQLLRSNFVMTSSLMARAELCERFRPIPSFFPTQDWPIVARVAQFAEVDFVPATVARYRRHGDNLSNGKHSPHEVAALLRRDIGIRRWMLVHLRARYLTVEDLADAYFYFLGTLQLVARVQGLAPENLVDVSEADRHCATRELTAGRSSLSEAGFVAAAGHFVAALSADPFDRDARTGLDCAQRRLVVPRPRQVAGPRRATTAFDYHIKAGYRCRETPDYFVDLTGDREAITYHPDAYTHAAELADRLGAIRIIDLGAGGAGKLVALHPRFEIVGLDYGPNVELSRRRFPQGVWHEHDLDRPGALPVMPDQLRGSVVICANVIEQLVHPEFLLDNLRGVLGSVAAIVISTPERDPSDGAADLGPPVNAYRVREWNVQEFAALLEGFGFEYGDLMLTTSDSARGLQNTILAVLYPSARRAEKMEVDVSTVA